MLPKKNRLNLRKRADFFKQAQRYYSPIFTIHYQLRKAGDRVDFKEEKQVREDWEAGDKEEQAKAAVVVKKKDIKTAVGRHKLTRKGRNALLPFLKKERPIDLVLVFKRQAARVDFKEIQQEVEKFDQWLQSQL